MDFWESAKSIGVNTFGDILAPVSTGVSETFGNLVLGVQKKVANATSKVVDTTDPFKKANTPATPPTAATPPPAFSASNPGVLIAAALVIFIIWMLSKKT